MCDFVIWNDEEIYTIGALKKKVPIAVRGFYSLLLIKQNRIEFQDDDCLCPIDLAETFAQANIPAVYHQDEGFWEVLKVAKEPAWSSYD